ncbi:hypothetical protein HHI36_013380 [Cryptolaemus montrouzieri]|uniref:Uncharacterized protein n=1 Tax=Cryptolaemus montrouzieri TaxID=559131 RepID=A0ABD2NHN0_9CUCU
MAFSEEDFAPVDVYASNSSRNVPTIPEISIAGLESQPSTSAPSTDMNKEDQLSSIDIPERSSSSLRKDIVTGTGEPSTSAVEIQSEPNAYLPITPEVRPYPTTVRNRKTNKMKTGQKNKKAKKIKSDEDSEQPEGSQFSLRESSTSPVDLDMDEETEDRSINYDLNMTPEKINENCYVLV